MEDVATRDFRAMAAALLADPVCATPPVAVVAARARRLQRQRRVAVVVVAAAVAAGLPALGMLALGR